MWPNLVQVGNVGIPTYLAINSLAFCLAIYWLYKRAERGGLDQNGILDLSLVIMFSGFLGARLFHILFEDLKFYLANPSYILMFWYGGFVYYGGFFAALGASYSFCRKRGYNFLAYADLFAPVIAGAYAMGRLGCLAAGCCFGRPTTLPWGIIFPPGAEAPAGLRLHPTQLYFSLWETTLCVLILYLQKRKIFSRSQGQYFGLWLFLHAIGRVFIEQFRGDFRGQKIFNLSLSTWLSAIALGLAIYMLTVKGDKNRKA